MEDPIKGQSSVPGNSGSKLRYPLRSATKPKDEKPPVAQSSAPRRGRSSSTVSQSVGVLDLSAKGKQAKPPRRLSIPAKKTSSPIAKQAGNITPISGVRGRGIANGPGKTETPGSDISRASSRKKFNILSSASYWLSQIKLSESAAKHSISLGFFKLGLEAGCEPLQKMRDELKSYVCRHNLVELGEAVKELFESFNITATLEQLQVSETCSQVAGSGTHSSDDDVVSSTSTVGSRKLKPKSLNTDGAKKEFVKKNSPPTRTRRSSIKTSDNSMSVSDAGSRSLQKKPQKQTKKDYEKDQKMKPEKKSASEEGPVSPQVTENTTTLEENKENMDASPAEEMSLTEVV